MGGEPVQRCDVPVVMHTLDLLSEFSRGFVGVDGLSAVCRQHLSIRIPGCARLPRAEMSVSLAPWHYFAHLLCNPLIISETSHSFPVTSYEFRFR